MIRLWTLLLAASIGFPEPGSAAEAAERYASQGASPASSLSLLDVPYLSQSELLCGGAAAAMVLRYWGTRSAPEEFAPLVDGGRSGIPTSALAAAVSERGFQAVAASGTEALVRSELTAGRPVVALIEDRPGAFHYVVIVGWHDRAVVLHDPARTPYVLMAPRDFERRWSVSRNWMLAVAPGPESAARPAAAPLESGSPAAEEGGGSGVQCDALVADGVRLARQNALAAAEPLLTSAAYQCDGARPLRELAGLRLLQKRWPEVRELAGRAIQLDPADAHAWRLVATARYIEGDPSGALDAWNHVREPRIDLVSVTGLHRMTHRAVERFLALDPGGVLTRSAFERTRRRLDELPAATLTRMEYVPRPAGQAEVRAHVVERTLLPAGRLTWAAIGLAAAATRELSIPIASPGRSGELIDVRWRFWPRRPGGGLALRAPARIGLFTIALSAERQPFDDRELADAERVSAYVALADWATGSFRWEARTGVARWTDSAAFATIGAAARIDAGRARVRMNLDGWLGERTFLTGALDGRWRSSRERRGFVADVSAVLDVATSHAPLDVWPAGDTGHARRALLRAHPVLDDGRLRVERLGRVLGQTSAEAQHWWVARAVPVGAAVFVDAARTARRAAGLTDAVADVDAGAGFRLALPGRSGTLRADVARGLRDGRTVLSVSWISD